MVAQTKRPMKPEYTRAAGQCMVAVIECVYEMRDAESMNEVLDDLRGSGAARVVDVYAVTETFDQASRILDRRAVQP